MALEEQQEGKHVQLFVYKLPKKNHDAMVKLVKKFTALYKKYGTQSWEIYQLNSTEAFDGSTSIAKIVSASPNEEIWVEVDHYKNRNTRDSVVSAIMQDPSAGEMFGALAGTMSEGFSLIMGEFNPLNV
jgi:uncharacterized protein YbaA (DUF1428 family)